MVLNTLANFRLPTEQQFRTSNINPWFLSANGFTQDVRQFHLGRMPKFTVDLVGCQCAYCGKVKDRRTMKIDHIIPMRVYCRYRLLQARSSKRSDCDRFYRDTANLLLACQRCNGEKSDWMPNETRMTRKDARRRMTAYEAALEVSRPGNGNIVLPQLYAKIVASRQVADRIANLAAAQHDFVMHGPRDRNTHPMRGAGRAVRSRYATRVSTNPYPSFDDRMAAIHNVVVDRLGVSRPDIDLSKSQLEPSQTAIGATAVRKDLRICLYCLGFFNKQAFELDHIRPVNRPVFGSFPETPENKMRYNDPRNIVPVCQGCNGSKGNKVLTFAFMDQRLRERIAEGLAGIETVLTTDADQQKAIQIRNKLFKRHAS